MRRLDRLTWLSGVVLASALAAALWEWRAGTGAGKLTNTTRVPPEEICLIDMFQGYRHSMDDWSERNEPASTDAMWHELLDCQNYRITATKLP